MISIKPLLLPLAAVALLFCTFCGRTAAIAVEAPEVVHGLRAAHPLFMHPSGSLWSQKTNSCPPISPNLIKHDSFTDGKVMMEYIGATDVPVSFAEVPIAPNIDFNFILGFAIDADPSGNPQNGKFSPYWNAALTPPSVQSIKARHPNVKVLASLSGWSIGTTVLSWYNPTSPSSWISNAFTSLKSLVAKYHLDGIDIDYENFPKKNSTFAFCIGELITRLKKENVITIATIAPFYKTVDPYIELFQRYGEVIDYVNHQFYTDRVKFPSGYLAAFKLRAGQFNASKLLPSYEVDGRGIQGDSFFEALELLERSGFEVNGVMIFSADASQKSGYYYEKRSQEFLLNSTANGTAMLV